jgi:hypothetical protein
VGDGLKRVCEMGSMPIIGCIITGDKAFGRTGRSSRRRANNAVLMMKTLDVFEL